MKWLENITGGYSSSAKVVGDTLVLSLPDASAPVVWRMELGEIKAAAFEIKQDSDGYVLTMKTPKGEAQNIAPFKEKSRAMKALMAASNAMEHAQSVTRTAANDGAAATMAVAPARKKGIGQLLAGIIGIILLCGFLFTLAQMSAPLPPGSGSQTAAMNSAGDTNGSPAGVPVSADDFLKNR